MGQDLDNLKKQLDLINSTLEGDKAEHEKMRKEQKQLSEERIKMIEVNKEEQLKEVQKEVQEYKPLFYVLFILFLFSLLNKFYFQLFP